MKKIICMILSLLMVLSSAPASVFATSTMAEESYAVSITNNPGTTFVLGHDYTIDV